MNVGVITVACIPGDRNSETHSIWEPIIEEFNPMDRYIVGDTITLECSVKSHVPVDFSWSVPNDNREQLYELSGEDPKYQGFFYNNLTIKNTSLDDSGKYTCRMSDYLHHVHEASTHIQKDMNSSKRRNLKKSEDSIKGWAARIRSLAVSCEFGRELDISLRDRFVCGFEEGKILDRLLEENKEITFEDAINMGESKMAAYQGYQIPSSSVKSESTLHHLRSCSNKKSDESKRHHHLQRHGKVNVNCTVCGKRRHSKDKCFFKNHI
ncbi:hypothetical protein WA026_001807 [Henosepilachna vigintioctopunctata]|uniref:Ig-like domain-containing protein n=1 Tax=Henosepilachna vigintioctopunctata TaxID=420089 RepID=A0AAW1URE5_9CUCU